MHRAAKPRRRTLTAVVGGLALLALVASAALAQPQAKSAQSAGTLVVDTSFDLKTIDPARMFEPTGPMIAVTGIYDTLLTFQGGDIQAAALDRPVVRVSADAKTFTFNLRTDVGFSDGTPLTAADVVFSLPRLINLKGNAVVPARRRHASRPDAYTVILTSETPEPGAAAHHRRTRRSASSTEGVKANGGTRRRERRQGRHGGALATPDSAGSGPYI